MPPSGMTDGAKPTGNHNHVWFTSGDGHGYVTQCKVCGATRTTPDVTIDKSLADAEPLHKILPS